MGWGENLNKIEENSTDIREEKDEDLRVNSDAVILSISEKDLIKIAIDCWDHDIHEKYYRSQLGPALTNEISVIDMSGVKEV